MGRATPSGVLMGEGFLDEPNPPYPVLEAGGIAVFVIGNTQYKGVKVDNAEHLETSKVGRARFERVQAIPRRVSLKIMTPYRDARGRFTRDSSHRQVYAEEFVLIGRKA